MIVERNDGGFEVWDTETNKFTYLVCSYGQDYDVYQNYSLVEYLAIYRRVEGSNMWAAELRSRLEYNKEHGLHVAKMLDSGMSLQDVKDFLNL